MTVGAAALIGSLVSACAGTSHAGQTSQTIVNTPTTAPMVQPLACWNYFHNGCPPLRMWRLGPHGWGCYPC
jgi:hypothetical protein